MAESENGQNSDVSIQLLNFEELCLLGCFHGGVNYRCLLGLCTVYRVLQASKPQKISPIDTAVKASQKTVFFEL
jgi:hypothetical protein